MKITGIVLLIFAALNFIVAIMATNSGASEQKFNASLMLVFLGGVFYYFGKSKENERKERERIAKEKTITQKQKEQADAKRRAEVLEKQKKRQ